MLSQSFSKTIVTFTLASQFSSVRSMFGRNQHGLGYKWVYPNTRKRRQDTIMNNAFKKSVSQSKEWESRQDKRARKNKELATPKRPELPFQSEANTGDNNSAVATSSPSRGKDMMINLHSAAEIEYRRVLQKRRAESADPVQPENQVNLDIACPTHCQSRPKLKLWRYDTNKRMNLCEKNSKDLVEMNLSDISESQELSFTEVTVLEPMEDSYIRNSTHTYDNLSDSSSTCSGSTVSSSSNSKTHENGRIYAYTKSTGQIRRLNRKSDDEKTEEHVAVGPEDLPDDRKSATQSDRSEPNNHTETSTESEQLASDGAVDPEKADATSEDSQPENISYKSAATVPIGCVVVGGVGALLTAVFSSNSDGGPIGGEACLVGVTSFAMFALPFVLILFGLLITKLSSSLCNFKVVSMAANYIAYGSCIASVGAMTAWTIKAHAIVPEVHENHGELLIGPWAGIVVSFLVILGYLYCKPSCFGLRRK